MSTYVPLTAILNGLRGALPVSKYPEIPCFEIAKLIQKELELFYLSVDAEMLRREQELAERKTK